MFSMTKLMEMEMTEQNKVALYVFNNLDKIENIQKNYNKWNIEKDKLWLVFKI